jgi:hypothetical protein
VWADDRRCAVHGAPGTQHATEFAEQRVEISGLLFKKRPNMVANRHA